MKLMLFRELQQLILQKNWDTVMKLLVEATDSPFMDLEKMHAVLAILEEMDFPKRNLERLRPWVEEHHDF